MQRPSDHPRALIELTAVTKVYGSGDAAVPMVSGKRVGPKASGPSECGRIRAGRKICAAHSHVHSRMVQVLGVSSPTPLAIMSVSGLLVRSWVWTTKKVALANSRDHLLDARPRSWHRSGCGRAT